MAEPEFCENYFLLKPEEASCLDLARILCCKDLGERNCFSTRADQVRLIVFRHRWIVFISMLLQKVLLGIKKPMAALGSAVEMWLNYPAFNGGFPQLLFNLFTGRLVRPDRASEGFTSLVGNIDKRLDLDTNVVGNEYYAWLAMMASKLSYENQSFVQNVVTLRWQMDFLEYYEFWNDFQELNTTYAIMFRDKMVDPNLIIIAFKGTDPFDTDDWITDIDISWYEFKDVGKIHGGFMKALGLQKSTGWPKQLIPSADHSNQKSYAYYTLRKKLKTLIHENENARFIVTGHSLGGALAILFAGVLAIHEEELLLHRLAAVYTFGQPRVGDVQFGEYMKAKLSLHDIKYKRYVYCNDMVPRLPYDDKNYLYKHFGPCLYFNSCYRGQALEEEPNKNYFSLIQVVPKILNAIYELIRSLLILPWTKGEQYKEGWVMKMFRITGLVIPGLTEHLTVDYVNVTRLGKLSSPVQPNSNLKQS